MKKILTLTLMITITMLLTGCKNTYNYIPLVIYNEADPYIKEFEQTIINDANGLFDIKTYDSQNSQLLQNEIIDELIEQEPKLLIVNPVDRLGAYTIIEKAKNANIPVVFFNREPLAEDLSVWNYALYVGALDEQSANIQVSMIQELFGLPKALTDLDKNEDGMIQAIVLKGEQGHQAAEKRTNQLISRLETYGYDMDYLAIQVCDWEREIAFNFMSDFMPDHLDDLELVVSNNDAMSLGAIDALIELQVFQDLNEDGVYDSENDEWIPVLGIDGLSEAIPYLENGTLYGTVLNDSDTMSKAIVELAEAIINGEDPNTITFEIIDNNFIWVDYKRFELNED